MQSFLKTFQRSQIDSIDTFLARRPRFSDFGKLAIAYELCKREDEHAILRPDNDDHWYGLLWNKLIADLESPPQLLNNTVKFITFNYDRSLEFFLYEAVRHSFELSGEQAMGLAGSLPILHVYGMLGRFHFEPAVDVRQYSPTLDAGRLRIAAGGIKVIPETRVDDRDFLIARSWMSEAEQIIFLGFGFDPLNVRRLGLSDVMEANNKQGKSVPRIFATTIGMTQSEVGAAVGAVSPRHGWTHINAKNRMALREWGVLN